MSRIKLTEPIVRHLPFPQSGQSFFWDSVLTGFGVRVSRNKKSFVAEGRLNGKTRRVTLGPYPALAVDVARKKGQLELSKMAQGIDQRALNAKAKQKTVKLSEVFAAFSAARKGLSPRTLAEYGRLFETKLGDWNNRPWIEISSQMVLKRHAEIGKNHGEAIANYAMRALGSVFRFAMKVYRDEGGKMLVSECPVNVLGDTKSWYKEKRRSNFIRPQEMPVVWKEIQRLENLDSRDFFLTLLFTGFRRSEAATLKWDKVDFDLKTIRLDSTKNGEIHVLPIPEFLFQLFLKRKAISTSDYVFPGPGATGHIVEVKSSLAKVVRGSGKSFTCHDLRRTFATYLESLDVPAYAVKKLLNHKITDDVTYLHYLNISVDRLRGPMEKLAKYILQLAGVVEMAEVLPIDEKDLRREVAEMC